jgi:hypothetical protein
LHNILIEFGIPMKLIKLIKMCLNETYIKVGTGKYYFSMSSRPALGCTQPPIQWVPGALSQGWSGRGVKLTTHLQLVPRSRKCGSMHPLPHTPSWRSA